MANKDHLAWLQQGMAAWNQWRAANREITPDLSEVDLTKEDLSRGLAKKSVKFQIIVYKLLISCKMSQRGFQVLHSTLTGDFRYKYRKINSFAIQRPFFMIQLIVSKL
jgi:hypothetical protein